MVNCQARRPLGAGLILGHCLQPLLLPIETSKQQDATHQSSNLESKLKQQDATHQSSKLNHLHCHPRRNQPPL